VPNAQHAVRQGKLLAKNVVAVLRGELPHDYFHKNAGAVASIGLGIGVFQSGNIAVKGLPAWFMHRGYHGLAIPMWERKIRVFANWILNFLLQRDTVGIIARSEPRAAFEEFASRPKPKTDAASAAPASSAPASSAPAATAPAATAKAPARASAKAPAKVSASTQAPASKAAPAAPASTAAPAAPAAAKK
jgi:NADH dehydrogenase